MPISTTRRSSNTTNRLALRLRAGLQVLADVGIDRLDRAIERGAHRRVGQCVLGLGQDHLGARLRSARTFEARLPGVHLALRDRVLAAEAPAAVEFALGMTTQLMSQGAVEQAGAGLARWAKNR